MLLIFTVVILLLVWFFGGFDVWGFEARPIVTVFLVFALLVQLFFRVRTRVR